MKLTLSRDLTDDKATACAAVDASAEEFRLRFITAGDGQTMAYQQKVREAEALMKNSEISPSETPHLVSEAAVDGVSRFDKAVEILTIYNTWLQVSAGIEALRIGTKAAINAATSQQQIASLSIVDWDSLLQGAPA